MKTKPSYLTDGFFIKGMLGRVKFLLIYFLSWVLLFEVFRLIFIFYHFGNTSKLSISTTLLTFVYGLRMDVSTASYISLPVSFFILLSLLFSFFKRPIIYKLYTAIILLFILLLVTADLELYTQWGFRIDVTPLRYLTSPKEAWASVSHLPIFLILFVIAICYSLLLYAFVRMLNKAIGLLNKPSHWSITLLSISVIICLQVVALRGGLQLAPINQSSVYFTTDNFANHAAINATWNFLHSVMNDAGMDKNPYLYMDDKLAHQSVDSLFTSSGEVQKVLTTSTPNIILIIWESFTDKATHLTIDSKEVTPGFNELKKEGLYFSQLYASGDRTDKGLSAILSGYPALPKTSIIRTPNKASKLDVLPKLLKARNYSTPFFYGGEPEFANIKSYLLQGGFDPLIQKSDFDRKDWNSKWGAHDGIVAKRVLEYVNEAPAPFFATWLTLSSHEPFEVPVAPVFKGQDHTSQFLNSIHYTDGVIADFVKNAKQQTWWKNTLLIIIADHGHIFPETGKRIDNFKIPMLWIGGALKDTGTLHEKIMSQTDLAATLAGQLGMNKAAFPFSKNTFDSSTKPWSFFSFNNGFGWVQPNGYALFDYVGKQITEKEGAIEASTLGKGKALQQIIFSDYMNK